MMEIRVRKDSINSTAYRAKFCYRRFLDADSETRICIFLSIIFYLLIYYFLIIYTGTFKSNKYNELNIDKKKIPARKILVAVK